MEEKGKKPVPRNYDQRIRALEALYVQLEQIAMQQTALLQGLVYRVYDLDNEVHEKKVRNTIITPN